MSAARKDAASSPPSSSSRRLAQIMLPRDPEGITGPKAKLADVVEIQMPKEDAPAKQAAAPQQYGGY